MAFTDQFSIRRCPKGYIAMTPCQKIFALVAATLLIIALPVSAPAQSSKTRPIVLQNATIHSMAAAGTQEGSILIQDGKIQAIGTLDELPQDAQVFDLRGFTVVPGLIDSRSTLWLSENAVKEKNDKGELNVADAIDLWNEDWREVAAQGVTTVYVQPGNASSLGGYGAVLGVGPQPTVDKAIRKGTAAAQAAIGITGNTSQARFAQIEKLKASIKKVKDALEKEKKEAEEAQKKAAEEAKKKAESEAKAKAEKPNAADKKEGGSEGKTKRVRTRGEGRPESGRGKRGRRPTPPGKKPDASKDDKQADGKQDKKETEKAETKKPDPTRELWEKVLAREIPLHVEVHHSDAIRRVLALATEFDIRVVLDGVSQAHASSDKIIESNRPTVIGPLWQFGTAPAYRKDANFEWIKPLSESGNLWAIATFSNLPRGSRLLRFQAAKAVAMGVSQEEALKAITIHAARMLGIAEQTGSLEAGKNADIAVFAGDPLDPSTATRMVICDGRIIFEAPAESNSSPALSQPELPKTLPSEYAIRTTRFLDEGKFKPATIVVRDGKITQISDESSADLKDIMIFDVQDAPVTPGLVVAHSHLKQNLELTNDAESDASHLRAVDCADPSSTAAKEMLAGGFTDVAFAPLSQSTSAGIVGHLKLGHPDFVQRPDVANKFVLAKSGRNTSRFPASLTGQYQLLDGLFAGQMEKTPLYVSSAVRESMERSKKANVEKVKSGERTALFVADTALEIQSALSLINANTLQGAILTSGDNVHQYADELVASNAGIILQPLNGREYDAALERLVQTCSGKLRIAFAGESPEQIRMTAAMLVAAGMPRDQVLRGLTGDAASILKMDQAGQLSADDHLANLIIWNGSPLNPASQPVHMVVGGKSVQQK